MEKYPLLLEINAHNMTGNGTKTQVIPYEVISVTTVTIIICLAGFLGNLAIAVIITTRKKMRTPVNWLLFNLAACNLAIVIVPIPFDVIHLYVRSDWPFGAIGCKYLLMPVMEHFAGVCVLTHTAVAAVRYITLRNAEVRKTIGNTHVKIAICFIWLVSFLVISATLMGFLGKFELRHTQVKLECKLIWITQIKRKIYRVCVFILTYIIPTSVTGFAYYQIHRIIVVNLESVDGCLTADVLSLRRKNTQRMNTIFTTMFLLFTLTTFPYQLFMFLFDFKLLHKILKLHDRNLLFTFDTLTLLFYAQVVINPLVLFYMSEEYRKEISCCVSSRRRSGSRQMVCHSFQNMSHTIPISNQEKLSCCHLSQMKSREEHLTENLSNVLSENPSTGITEGLSNV